MVNYCCVSGCGRNSRNNKHLYYYGVPKEIVRQEQWLIAAGRRDLLKKPSEKRVTYRICSSHFSPSSFKNKHLCSDAIPTLRIPELGVKASEDNCDDKSIEANVLCDHCNIKISGFRYKCVRCTDYDLCPTCEMKEVHSQHYMLRIPAAVKFKTAETLVKRWQELYIGEYLNEDSSDDEPISKYISKTHDNNIDLDDDVKESIRREVDRVLSYKPDHYEHKRETSQKRSAEQKKSSKKRLTMSESDQRQFSNDTNMEVIFMNEMHSVACTPMMDVKVESPALESNSEEPRLPMLQKLSDDLTELIMEVTDQKTILDL